MKYYLKYRYATSAGLLPAGTAVYVLKTLRTVVQFYHEGETCYVSKNALTQYRWLTKFTRLFEFYRTYKYKKLLRKIEW